MIELPKEKTAEWLYQTWPKYYNLLQFRYFIVFKTRILQVELTPIPILGYHYVVRCRTLNGGRVEVQIHATHQVLSDINDIDDEREGIYASFERGSRGRNG